MLAAWFIADATLRFFMPLVLLERAPHAAWILAGMARVRDAESAHAGLIQFRSILSTLRTDVASSADVSMEAILSGGVARIEQMVVNDHIVTGRPLQSTDRSISGTTLPNRFDNPEIASERARAIVIDRALVPVQRMCDTALHLLQVGAEDGDSTELVEASVHVIAAFANGERIQATLPTVAVMFTALGARHAELSGQDPWERFRDTQSASNGQHNLAGQSNRALNIRWRLLHPGMFVSAVSNSIGSADRIERTTEGDVWVYHVGIREGRLTFNGFGILVRWTNPFGECRWNDARTLGATRSKQPTDYLISDQSKAGIYP